MAGTEGGLVETDGGGRAEAVESEGGKSAGEGKKKRSYERMGAPRGYCRNGGWGIARNASCTVPPGAWMGTWRNGSRSNLGTR